MDNFELKLNRIITTTFITLFASGTYALRNIQLTVPETVNIGGTPTLGCSWLLDADETLYSVKWYWGYREFFRYIPKELPHTRIFPVENINVDVSRSSAGQVTLRDANRALSGRFRCEVSADAPSFHTEFRSAFMHVLDLPASAPKVVAEKTWYTVGDGLHAICAVPAADPPANITWLLNGHEVKGNSISHLLQSTSAEHRLISARAPDAGDTASFNTWNDGYSGLTNTDVVNPDHDSLASPRRDTDNQDSATTQQHLPSISHLAFVVRPEMYEHGSLRLTCIASVYSVYSARAELIFNQEKPQIASVLGIRNSASESITRTSILLMVVEVYVTLFAAR